MRAHRLIEAEWPAYTEPGELPPVTAEELESRIAAVRNAIEQRDLTHAVVYGDREHYANLTYLTNFDPRFEEALLIIGREGAPLLVVGNECEGYLPISPLWTAGRLRHERYQPFSLLNQPRDQSRTLESIFRTEGIEPGSRVGAIGWKYYDSPVKMDLPSYLVDALREGAGFAQVNDATDILMSPAHGLRAHCTAAEIARFEWMNVKASEAMRRMIFGLRPGMTDHELVVAAQYDGTPLSCYLTCKTGPTRISLASPRGSVMEVGHRWSANVGFWGANVCRAAWVAESAADLPEPARGYVDEFAGPYFVAMSEWLRSLEIGRTGGELYDLVMRALPEEMFHVSLNPGHLIHLDEWLSSPFFLHSTIALRSGMVIQTDIIPSSQRYFSTRMEDGLALADAGLRQDLREQFPDCYERCLARREFAAETLGLELPEEILPLSNLFGIVVPYLLRPKLLFALTS